MLKNYLTVALRTMLRHKFFSFITIFGLAVAIGSCLVITLFVKDELSYDKHHEDADRIYRVVKDFVNDDGSRIPDATTPPALSNVLQNEIPEIQHVVRLFPSWGREYYVRTADKKFIEKNVYRADSSIFDVFTLPFVYGNARTAFSDPQNVVLTASTAKKYFGEGNPIGKTLELDDMGLREVSAVIADIPSHSHFNFDFLISTRTLRGNIDADWGFYNFYTYVKLKENTSIGTVEPKIVAAFKKHNPQNNNIFYTQALTGIHLDSHLKWELLPNSDRSYVYIIITIGLFIIVIAGINYVNLSTARSSLRAREIGVRKVTGANRASLVRQFLSEAVLTTLLATIIGFLIAQLLLPAINSITQKELSLFSGNTFILIAAFGGALFVGMLAGIYPALFLSSFDPARVLKGETTGNRTFRLRKVLVVVQFTISIILITGALVIHRQVDYVQSAKLGFDKEQVVVVNDAGMLSRSQRKILKQQFTELPGVKIAGTADGELGGQNWTNDIRAKGSDNAQLVNFLNVDGGFLEALQLELIAGRGFSEQFPRDTMDGIILNETAVKQLGIPSPAVGQQVVWAENEDTTYYATVLGVVKDFHFTSLRNEIKPFAFVTDNSRQWYFVLRLEGDDIAGTMAQVQATWEKHVEARPFRYYFLDDTFDSLYRSERNFRTVFFYITALAIIIACLGLFGLASFATEQRTKEIGIRKVLGASVPHLVGLLSKDFIRLVFFAACIATPISWYVLRRWLEDFAYRIDIGWFVFVLAGVAAVFIALATISFQAIRAAAANPVKNLRTE